MPADASSTRSCQAHSPTRPRSHAANEGTQKKQATAQSCRYDSLIADGFSLVVILKKRMIPIQIWTYSREFFTGKKSSDPCQARLGTCVPRSKVYGVSIAHTHTHIKWTNGRKKAVCHQGSYLMRRD